MTFYAIWVILVISNNLLRDPAPSKMSHDFREKMTIKNMGGVYLGQNILALAIEYICSKFRSFVNIVPISTCSPGIKKKEELVDWLLGYVQISIETSISLIIWWDLHEFLRLNVLYKMWYRREVYWEHIFNFQSIYYFGSLLLTTAFLRHVWLWRTIRNYALRKVQLFWRLCSFYIMPRDNITFQIFSPRGFLLVGMLWFPPRQSNQRKYTCYA